MAPQRLMMVAGMMALGASTSVGAVFADHVFVATSDPPKSTGSCAAFDIEAPWDAAVGLEATAPDTIARHFFGLHYVVHRRSGEIQVIDPQSFDTVLTFSVGADSNPHDIVVVATDSAYVSRHASALLYEVDPRTGDLLDAVDLSALADADGIPEMSMMALDGHNLLIQLQRLDASGLPVAPSYLGVVDVRDNQLVDVDPDEAGVQGIRLTGLVPGYKMQIEGRRLYVSEPGLNFDSAGGIDEIDLDTLTALGFITTEAQVPLDISGFVLTSPTKGFVLTHTDIALSSHLQPFSRIDGSGLGPELLVTFARVDSVAHDFATNQLFFPDPNVKGVHVFDATTHAQLSRPPVDVGSSPVDLLIARFVTPGEANDLSVLARDPVTEELSIAYTPACGAADHTIVFGRLEDVSLYEYSGQVCGIGNSGEYRGGDFGDGSYFFLVVGNDGAVSEGSYGRDSTSSERPEDLNDPTCALVQDLSRRCD